MGALSRFNRGQGPRAAAVPRVKDPEAEPTIVVEMEGGNISYYPHSKYFIAHCKCGHGQCDKRMKSWADAGFSAAAPTGGRPLGYLAAFLLIGTRTASKDEHWLPENLDISLEDRIEGRRILGLRPNAVDLFRKERQPFPGEPEEAP